MESAEVRLVSTALSICGVDRRDSTWRQCVLCGVRKVERYSQVEDGQEDTMQIGVDVEDAQLTGLCIRPATYSVSQSSKSCTKRAVEMIPYLTSYRLAWVILISIVTEAIHRAGTYQSLYVHHCHVPHPCPVILLNAGDYARSRLTSPEGIMIWIDLQILLVERKRIRRGNQKIGHGSGLRLALVSRQA